jgi:glyoxylase-like metal-dependent hydrolase (beta-lactamase superfamily II)
MKVERHRGGPWGQNCYVISEGSIAIVIDPGGRADELLDHLAAQALKVAAIINTHGHFDHIGGVHDLMTATGAPFWLSRREDQILRSTNMMRFIFKVRDKIAVPRNFEDLDTVAGPMQFGAMSVEAIGTPGHTPGGYCLRIGDHLFTGDTLLPTAPLPVELPGASADDLATSLGLLATLPGTITAHPGHGNPMRLSEALDIVRGANTQPQGSR